MAERLAPVALGRVLGFGAVSVAVGLLAGTNPKLAIAAAIAICFVLIAFADLTAALALFGFFSFLELLNLGSSVTVGKLGGVFLVLGWIAFVVTREDASAEFFSVHPGMTMVLAGFMGWVALSALWAESTANVESTFGRYLLNVILFVIVFTAIRDRKQAITVISGFLAGAVAAGLYGVLFGTATAADPYGPRLAGTNLDPNELASTLVAGMAMAVGLAANLKRLPLARLIAIGAGGFCFLAVMLTGSRGGITAIACMLVAAVIFGGRWRVRAGIAGVMIAFTAFFYISFLAPAEIRDRIKTTTGEERTMEGRATLWEIGERMVKAHPVNGVGAGNFQTASRHYLLKPGAVYRSDEILTNDQVTHNTYLQTAAELGLVGLALFGAILFFSLGCCLRAARQFKKFGDIPGEALARSVLVGMIGLLVADIFISQTVNKQLWLVLGIGPALLAASRPDRIILDERGRGQRFSRLW